MPPQPAGAPSPAPVLARTFAALAGGQFTDPQSRHLAARIEAAFPGAGERVRAARRFHAAAARLAVGDGARGVIFAAAGLPIRPFLHADAAAAGPGALFCYADPDPGACWLRRELCGGVTAIQGRVTGPEAILEAAGEAGLCQPLQAQIQGVLTYMPDGMARDVVARWAALLGPGSSLALSVGIMPEGAGEFAEIFGSLACVHAHTPASVRSWLEDAGLEVASPGVVPCRDWVLGRAQPGAWRAPQVCGAVAGAR